MELFREEEVKHLIVDDAGKAYLLETARWGRFVGLVFAIVLLLLTLMLPLMMSVSPVYQQVPFMFVILYSLLIVGINVYPLYALIKSAALTKTAINTLDQYKFTRSLKLTRNLYMYIGILTIIMIVFYGLIIIFAVTMAATAGAMS